MASCVYFNLGSHASTCVSKCTTPKSPASPREAPSCSLKLTVEQPRRRCKWQTGRGLAKGDPGSAGPSAAAPGYSEAA